MKLLRRAILAFALIAGLVPAMAQVPAPVPALPDTERRQTYSITSSTCACAINFALYGDGTDYQSWVEVFVNGTRVNFNDAAFGWTITSPSGPIGNLARPIANAVLTFNQAQTGTIQIVGARRPRRTSQFSENAGVPARNLNQLFNDVVSQNRETWDKINDVTGRGFFAPPGQTGGVVSGPLTGIISGPSSVVDGNVAIWNGTSGGALRDGGSFPRQPYIDVTSSPYFCIADSGVTDNGPCLRAAYDAAAIRGATLYIPPSSNYFGVSTCRNNGVFDGTSLTAPNGNKSVSIVGGGWNLKPLATPQGSWLLPNSSFPSTCSWIHLAGTDVVTGTVFRDFAIGEFGGAYGTPKGFHGIFVDSANPAFFIDHLNIDHIFIANMATGYSIKLAGNNATPFAGAITNSIIQNSALMSINAPFLGDGVRIEGNTLGGNATIDSRNVGIQFSNISGGTSTIISRNNVLNFNGKIVVDSAIKCVIRDNELEQQFGTTNTNGAVIDLNGSTAAVENCTVTGNSITQNSSVGNYKPVSVGNAINTSIYDNRIVLASASPYDYVSVNVGLAQGVWIGPNRCAYNGTTTDFACAVSAVGVNGSQYTPFGFTLAGTSSQTVVKTTGTGNGTILIPTATSPALDTFALLGAAQVFLSKSLVSSTNILGGVTMTLGSDATGDLYYRNSGGVLTRLPIGSASNVLTVTAGLPAWATAAAGMVVGATTVTGGSTATNDLFFNNAGVLGRVAAANSSVLVTNGSGVASWSTTIPGTPTINLTNGSALPYTALPSLSANQLLGALTATAPSGQSVPSCSTSSSVLQWTSGTGFSCNTAITAGLATLATNAGNGATISTSTNASFFPLFVSSSTNSNQSFNLDTTFTYNPSTDTLTATNFAGNASTATNATNTAITDDNATSATVFPTWVDTASGNRAQKTSSTGLKFLPSTGALTANAFVMPPGTGAFNAGFGATAAQATSMILNGGSSVGAYINFAAGGTAYAYFGSSGVLTGGTVTELLLQAQAGNGLHFQTNGTNSDRIAVTSAGLVTLQAKVGYLGTAPALTSCGTTPAIAGTDTAGEVTMGTGSPTGCVITFNSAYAAAPYCNVTWQTNLASMVYTISTTAITLTQTATSSNKVNYHCAAR